MRDCTGIIKLKFRIPDLLSSMQIFFRFFVLSLINVWHRKYCSCVKFPKSRFSWIYKCWGPLNPKIIFLEVKCGSYEWLHWYHIKLKLHYPTCKYFSDFSYFLLPMYDRASAALGSNFRNRDLDGFTRVEVPLNPKITFLAVGLCVRVCVCYQHNSKTIL